MELTPADRLALRDVQKNLLEVARRIDEILDRYERGAALPTADQAPGARFTRLR